MKKNSANIEGLRPILDLARRMAERDDEPLGVSHVLRMILSSDDPEIQSVVGAESQSIRAEVMRMGRESDSTSVLEDVEGLGRVTSRLAHVLERAKAESVTSAGVAFLLALSDDRLSQIGKILSVHGITRQRVQDIATGRRPSDQPRGILETYGRDLVDQMRRNPRPFVGREEEIEEMLDILQRFTGPNNPVLVGEAGSGKTAIVEAIARMIAEGVVPSWLGGRRIIELDIDQILSQANPGDVFRGIFEAADRERAILFVDEIHKLARLPEVRDLLKTRLSDPDTTSFIGATTTGEKSTTFEGAGVLADPAFTRRFGWVDVSTPSEEQIVKILESYINVLETRRNVVIGHDALEAAARFSDALSGYQPAKSIELLEDTSLFVSRSGSVGESTKFEELWEDGEELVTKLERERAKLGGGNPAIADALLGQIQEVKRKLEEERIPSIGITTNHVTAEDVAETITRKSGVPVSVDPGRTLRKRLEKLQQELSSAIVGQSEAVDSVIKTVQRVETGLKSQRKGPRGVFLFLGPTGTGKTETAKALSRALFGSEDRLVREDMTRYAQSHATSGLTGSPPGYVGSQDVPQMAREVKAHPYSVVLLDEIDKADPKTFDTLLPLLDEGKLSIFSRDPVDFSNTYVIMSSNFGTGAWRNKLLTEDEKKRMALDALRGGGEGRASVGPEFLGRVQNIVVFNALADEAIWGIMLKRLSEVLSSDVLKRQGYVLQLTRDAKINLAERSASLSREKGGRGVKDVVEEYIENPLAEVVRGRVFRPGPITIDVSGDELTFNGLTIDQLKEG